MNALDAAGIYLALDVNSSKYSINRNVPAPSYNHVYLQNVFATIGNNAIHSQRQTQDLIGCVQICSNSTLTF